MTCKKHTKKKLRTPICWVCRSLLAMKLANNTEKDRKKMTKTHTLMSPSGKTYRTNNLTKFANRFRNLTRSGLSKIVNERQTSYKGWKAV